MKAIPHFLVASVIVLGTACTSTNTGSSASGSTTAGTGAGGSTAGSSAVGSPMGSSTNSASAPDGNSGLAAGGGVTPPGAGGTAGPGQTAASGGASASGGAAAATGAADVTAFMGTFATMQDPVFLLTAASSNLLELQAGQVASQKASNADVKKYAQMMISHHTKSTQELKAVATPLGVTPSPTLMPVHQAMLDRLNTKTGKDFDEAYMDLMETAHKLDIALFEVKSKAAEKPTVQAFATKTLPMLRSHQTMASTIEKKVD